MKIQAIYQAPLRSMEADETLADAAGRMAFHEVGALPVFRSNKLAGILSERDIVRAVADEVDLSETSVADYMAEGPLAVQSDGDVAEAARLMSTYGLRHLPVIERGRVVGMLSIRDLIDAEVEGLR